MINVKRSRGNPILAPSPEFSWEAVAAHNPSVIKDGSVYRCVYRAMSSPMDVSGSRLELSTIGYAESRDGVHFKNRKQLIVPEFEWEKFGCEDPRVTRFEGRYYIFYTAISHFPFNADGIRVAVAITDDWVTFEKHLVTPFNAKAMALFPERVDGRIAVVVTANTDRPPARIGLALLDKPEDLWSDDFWNAWYAGLDTHLLPIGVGEKDQIEVGAAPLKMPEGWLMFYSYIYNYFSPPPVFGVQAVLLDRKDPQKLVGTVKRPFMTPEEASEKYGRVPNVIFPSGALKRGASIYLYYGATDTTSAVATIGTAGLMEQLVFGRDRELVRAHENPIIEPLEAHAWENLATFNPAALYEGGKVHIVYRAMSRDNTSVMGYASSVDGIHLEERLLEPIYVPRADFEAKRVAGGNSGCEDPRLTVIGGTVYMCYTAYDGTNPPRVAFTSIALKDFLAKQWRWTEPLLISPPGTDDKDAALFPAKIGGKYAFLHRLGSSIWLDFVDNLDEFRSGRFLGGEVLMDPRETAWDSARIGIAGPPIETEKGWLLLYHGVSRRTHHYSIRAALLSKRNPERILYRTHDTILEPLMRYEKEGIVSNVVFPCGAAVLKGTLFVYYGAADKVIGVASIKMKKLLDILSHEARFHSDRI
jgi:beta-1,2-mannobiose phosphorylase / 1,2-beta-oligomannan phosphorylase